MKSWKQPTNEMIDRAPKIGQKGNKSPVFFFAVEKPRCGSNRLLNEAIFSHLQILDTLMMVMFNSLPGPNFNTSRIYPVMCPMKLLI